MKFTLFSLVALACASSALATPSPVATEDSVILKKAAIDTYAAETRNIDERAAASVTGTVSASALKYHTCPKTSCTAVGQFPAGTKITIICRTDTSTTVVEGWPWWDRISYNGHTYYVSDYYVAWTGGVPAVC